VAAEEPPRRDRRGVRLERGRRRAVSRAASPICTACR
jgi:hypothetical protein